jgi:hypothetical protein
MNHHLEDVRRTNSVCMIHQHRWSVRVCSWESVSHSCWIWSNVWIGRSSSVVNLPSTIHRAVHRSYLFDSFTFVILCLQQFDGKLCVFAWNILHWSWDRTVVFFNHSPILSRFSPLRRYQSLVKVDEIAPFWYGKKVPSIFILSFFLELWYTHKRFLFLVFEMPQFLPLFDGDVSWLCWSMWSI